jgi:protein SCO1
VHSIDPTRHLSVLAAALAGALVLSPAGAQPAHDDPHAHHAQADKADAKVAVVPEGVRVTLADVALRDQDGRALRLRSDAIGERIVVVNFIYTTCTTVCPVSSAVMAQLQGRLGARLGRDVALLTLTVDPLRDTPVRLKDYARRVGAGAGWAWLTGAKPQVDEALRAFGAYTPDFAEHPPLVLVGDAQAGRWQRFYGFPTPDQLAAAVAELSTARSKAGLAG